MHFKKKCISSGRSLKTISSHYIVVLLTCPLSFGLIVVVFVVVVVVCFIILLNIWIENEIVRITDISIIYFCFSPLLLLLLHLIVVLVLPERDDYKPLGLYALFYAPNSTNNNFICFFFFSFCLLINYRDAFTFVKMVEANCILFFFFSSILQSSDVKKLKQKP